MRYFGGCAENEKIRKSNKADEDVQKRYFIKKWRSVDRECL
jgi:hypothetical protein